MEEGKTEQVEKNKFRLKMMRPYFSLTAEKRESNNIN
jgi:hypothetical protein